MKNITILVLLSINFAFSQKSEIDSLTLIKNELLQKKNKINDSINKIDVRLNFLDNKNKKYKTVEQSHTRTFTRGKAKIKNKPSLLGDVIGYIDKEKIVQVYDYYDTYWLIKKDSIMGYTNELYLNINIEMKKMKRKHDKNEIKKKYGEDIANKIYNRRILIGMTEEMAKLSIGKPLEVNKSTGSWGEHEQWVYEDRYLYFENGKLTSWQD